MTTIEPVDFDWLVLLINGYAPQAQKAAGGDAVPVERVSEGQPSFAAGVTEDDKRQLAEDLWSVFAGPSPTHQVVAFSDLFAGIAASPHVGTDGRLAWRTARTSPSDLLAASCIVGLFGAITTYGWARLGTCAGCDCGDVYVDRAGRGRPRRFCSATCLNRAKVRAFRSRQASS